jgi:mycofactocin system glycosyltransferase
VITELVGERGAVIPPPGTRDLPAGFRVALDPGTRFRDGGRVLVGGSPLRLVRLSTRAAAVVATWRRGGWADSPTARAVARCLLDRGLVHPRPSPGGPTRDEVTVVVPVRDRPAALARCLASLGPCHQVVVVDDASEHPEWTARVATRAGARVVRRAVNGGPAAARNTGLAHCTTPYVAFVDSDCRPEPGWLEALLPQFRDPAVAVVAPRVVPDREARGWIASYERARSSLDLGPREGPVVPCSRIAYVPSATLAARRDVLGGGFADSLRTGEDVDLVWRVHRAGWAVRYVPAAVVRHAHRPRLRDWARRRYAYGTAAAPLALRHPGQVPPVVVSRWTLAAWLLALCGRPALATTVTGVAAGLLARRLPGRRRASESARLVVTGTALAGEQLGRALTRTWWPLALPAAAVSRRARVALGAAALLPPVVDWVRRRPGMDPLRFAAAYLIDDVAYGAGVWRGCLASRTAAPLLPRLASPRGRVGREERP